jgi:hypothetical protein
MIKMVFVFLIVLIMALIIANLFISILIPKKKRQRGFINPEMNKQETAEMEVVPVNNETNEKNQLIVGNLASINQKMGLLNSRLINLEQAMSVLARERLGSEKNESIGLNAMEKKKIKDISEFKEDAKIRIEVLEAEVERLKGKPLVEQKKLETFDEKTEQKIRSLVYNTNKK